MGKLEKILALQLTKVRNKERIVAKSKPTLNLVTHATTSSVTLQAAIHLGKDSSENLRSTRNQSMRSLEQLFQVTGKLTTDQKEITGIPVIDWQQQMWQRTTLLTGKAVQFATAKTCLFRFSAVSGKHQSISRQSMEGQDSLVHGIASV